ncbi:hypothetical protein GCM10010521_38630 [Streptomyces rameus]|uniref:Integrase n=1 Tax=Streptomyces rameus TaxID=68261 RepID=A0ABP6NGM1_9ACTN
METYLTDITSLKLKPRSLDDYWSKSRNDIIPGVGKHRLDKLQPEYLERMYRAMLDAGHAPSHVVKVHRILSRVLKIAHRRHIVGENVAALVDPPRLDETEANPFTKEEAKAFLEAASKRPTFMRWIVGVGMGFRQGETLGLRWSYVDLEAELFRPERQLQRLTWRHGCDNPHACGGRLHRFEPCPPESCGRSTTSCSHGWTADHWIRAPTTRNSRSCSRKPGSMTAACTTGAATPPARS